MTNAMINGYGKSAQHTNVDGKDGDNGGLNMEIESASNMWSKCK